MSVNLSMSESKFIELSRIALTNAESHKVINSLIAEYGVDQEKIAEGWKIYNSTKAIWEKSQQENSEKRVTYIDYQNAYDNFQALYKRHRAQTLIFFKKDPKVLITLGVQGKFPTKYNELFDDAKMFYQTIKNNTEIQAKVQILKLTPEIADQCLTNLQDLMSKRAVYEKEFGEAQDSTKNKDTAIIELQNWMEDFYIAAKVALFDHRQLLETLGIFVRS
ncbi:MAG: hypothetical protein MI739_10150 [Bacteroidales bacterium]|nr:hypothetical protein [Bacteroidales bacterium]